MGPKEHANPDLDINKIPEVNDTKDDKVGDSIVTDSNGVVMKKHRGRRPGTK